jgi:hypothetical protein
LRKLQLLCKCDQLHPPTEAADFAMIIPFPFKGL